LVEWRTSGRIWHHSRLLCSANLGAQQPFPIESKSMRDTYQELADYLVKRAKGLDETPSKYIVALAGCPGSGKSTTAHAVCDLVNQSLPNTCAVLPMDGFHLYRRELDLMENPKEAHERRGAPWTFNPSGLISVLKTLREKGEAKAPSFDHAVGDPVEEAIELPHEVKVVILEGNYVLMSDGEWEGVRGLVDELWFLDVDMEQAMERVVRRHMAVWGWPEERARARVAYNDQPNAELIFESKENADRVIQSVSDANLV